MTKVYQIIKANYQRNNVSADVNNKLKMLVCRDIISHSLFLGIINCLLYICLLLVFKKVDQHSIPGILLHYCSAGYFNIVFMFVAYLIKYEEF